MGEEIGFAKIDFEGNFIEGNGELESLEDSMRSAIINMLIDAGTLSEDSGDFRRLIVSYPNYEYLITVGPSDVQLILRNT